MLPDKKIKCHLTGFEKSCFECVTEHGCRKWTQILGTHPQTGEAVSRWDCADQWAPVLQVEQTAKLNQLATSVDSLRNETVRIATLQQIEKGEELVTRIQEQVKALEAPPQALKELPDAGS